jgi:hypothetical protein
MAKARALDRRRKSVRNIRKITRTMELIATARFKKAMDRSVAARDYTKQLAKILENIAGAGAGVVHPLLEIRPTKRSAAAKAVILADGRIEVSSEAVAEPVAVRYAWADNPVCNMYSAAGLPLTPFRTDDFPGVTVSAK